MHLRRVARPEAEHLQAVAGDRSGQGRHVDDAETPLHELVAPSALSRKRKFS